MVALVAASELIREREQIAHACRQLAAEGLLIGTAGNVSARSGELVAITATGAPLAEVGVDEVTIVDLDGNVVAGELAPTSELDLHLGVYDRFDAAGAVVHTHAPMATAALLRDRRVALRPLPDAAPGRDGAGGALPTFGTPELADGGRGRARGTYRRADGEPRRDHLRTRRGESGGAALLLEWACTVYWRARALGEPRDARRGRARGGGRRRGRARLRDDPACEPEDSRRGGDGW